MAGVLHSPAFHMARGASPLQGRHPWLQIHNYHPRNYRAMHILEQPNLLMSLLKPGSGMICSGSRRFRKLQTGLLL
jgi:hypothetical protein